MLTDFLDSNVVLYAFQDADERRRSISTAILEESILNGATVSTQVLVEVASVLLRGGARGRAARVREALAALQPYRLVTVNSEIVSRAVDAHSRYGIHFYDGMIVAAAERAGCHRIWSEDLNPGQSYFGVRVENPF